METAYEISIKMKQEDDRPAEQTYISLEEALKHVKQQKDEIPFPKAQPKRFTVHASADPSEFTLTHKIRFSTFSICKFRQSV